MSSKIIIVSKYRTPGLFDGARYAEVVVNERYVGEERSGSSTDYQSLAAFIDKVSGLTEEEKSRAKAELRTYFGIPT